MVMFGMNFKKDEYLELNYQYEAKVKELGEAEIYISRLTTEVDTHKETIEQMAAKHAVEVEELKSKLAKTEKSVNSKVNCALASIGVTNFAVETIYTDNNISPSEALKKFMALTGGDKTAYYNENKALITHALASQKLNQG